MGQFSWCCGLCDQEVMHGHKPGYEWTKAAAILWPNGDIRRGIYEDGYGDIAGVNLVDQLGGWRLVHQRCLTKQGGTAEEAYKSLKPERHASDQGWWPGEREALRRYGPPEFSELSKDNTYFCRGCNRTWEARWSGGVCPFGCERPEGVKDYWELVEPFHYLDYDLGEADGLVICHNEHEERPNWNLYHELREKGDAPEVTPTKVEPCFYYGQKQQARVTKPEEWDDRVRYEDDGKPDEFYVRCPSCKSDNVEIVELTPVEAPNICEFCGHESEDGCHQHEVHWCGACRYEHECEVTGEG